MKAFPDAIGIDNKDRGRKQDWENLDLLDYKKLFWFIHDYGIEYVLHNAAIPSVPDSFKDPMKTYINNVNASLNLIDVCKKLDVKKLIFASTSSVDGPSPYGHSKKFIEEALKHSGINFTVLRYFNVFGSGQRENIVKIMYDKIKANEPLIINGDGSTSRDFTYIDNVVIANKKSIYAHDKEVLEAGCGESHTLMALYKLLKEKLNPSYDKLSFGPERIGDIKYSKANTFLAKNEITYFYEGINKWLEGD
jgi:nucleoside-diphosphate-sugar epimerase